MRVFEKLFTVRPDVLYCGNVAILGKQNIQFDCRTEELLYARVPGGADECLASPPTVGRTLVCFSPEKQTELKTLEKVKSPVKRKNYQKPHQDIFVNKYTKITPLPIDETDFFSVTRLLNNMQMAFLANAPHAR